MSPLELGVGVRHIISQVPALAGRIWNWESAIFAP